MERRGYCEGVILVLLLAGGCTSTLPLSLAPGTLFDGPAARFVLLDATSEFACDEGPTEGERTCNRHLEDGRSEVVIIDQQRHVFLYRRVMPIRGRAAPAALAEARASWTDSLGQPKPCGRIAEEFRWESGELGVSLRLTGPSPDRPARLLLDAWEQEGGYPRRACD
jgi:hypothetical protein